MTHAYTRTHTYTHTHTHSLSLSPSPSSWLFIALNIALYLFLTIILTVCLSPSLSLFECLSVAYPLIFLFLFDCLSYCSPVSLVDCPSVSPLGCGSFCLSVCLPACLSVSLTLSPSLSLSLSLSLCVRRHSFSFISLSLSLSLFDSLVIVVIVGSPLYCVLWYVINGVGAWYTSFAHNPRDILKRCQQDKVIHHKPTLQRLAHSPILHLSENKDSTDRSATWTKKRPIAVIYPSVLPTMVLLSAADRPHPTIQVTPMWHLEGWSQGRFFNPTTDNIRWWDTLRWEGVLSL